MKKLLLLDMDGTVRRPKLGAKFISSPDDQEIIPEATIKIREYHLDNWLCIGITNQGGVAADHKTLNGALLEQRITLDLCKDIWLIYFCPDLEGNICWCVGKDFSLEIGEPSAFQGQFCKPSPGMLEHAIAAHDGDKSTSLYVSDRPEDEAAANAANVPFMWASDWWK